MSQVARPELRWLERGEGEPLVLLHGLMGRMDHWEAQLEGLEGVCRPIALSLPIFDRALERTSIEALAGHVAAFLRAVDLPHAVVGGNSLGGHVALQMALAHPECVTGLVLTGSSGLFERGFARGVPHRPTTEYVRSRMLEVVHDPGLVTDSWVESVRATVNERTSALRVLRFAQAAKRHTLADRLPEITVPVLLVWGEDDRITPPDVALRFASLLPEAELALLSRCGHAPMLERPEAFNRLVAGWLERTRARRERWPALLWERR
jgi:pimeloyl-ACP methyl ester carboxylesterase